MAEREIMAGDIVQLKSGGPMMTVSFLTSGGMYDANAPKDKATCQWFPNNSAKPESETFPLTSLQNLS